MENGDVLQHCFIGHNFGDYKNLLNTLQEMGVVLQVTILETTKTIEILENFPQVFYRSQFWRLQKHTKLTPNPDNSFIGHNFGDYKNTRFFVSSLMVVLQVTILETTKTRISSIPIPALFYRSQFWRLQKLVHTTMSTHLRLQKPQMVSANDTMKVRSYSESPHFTK